MSRFFATDCKRLFTKKAILIYKAELNARKFIEKKNQTSCEFESVRDTGSRVSKYILLLTVNNLLK